MMWQVMKEGGGVTLNNLPFLVMQAIAIIGIFCIFLMLSRRAGNDRFYRVNPGIVLGLVGFLLAWMVTASTTEHMRLYVRLDLLYLSGLLGGIRGGLFCLTFMLGALWLFEDGPNGHLNVIDMSIMAAVGVGMNRWLGRRLAQPLRWRDIIIIVTVRLVVSLVSPLILALAGLLPVERAARIVGLRIPSLVIPMIVMSGVLGLLRWDARQRAERIRQYRANRTESVSGLPNRLALRDHLRQLTQQVGQRPQTLILIEVSNLGDLVALHGHPWGEYFWQRMRWLLERQLRSAEFEKYSPNLFAFSDALLAVILHDISVVEAQQRGLLPRLSEELNVDLRKEEENEGLLPRLSYGVAGFHSGSAIDVEQVMRNLSLALHSDDQPIGYFAPSLVDRVAQDERVRRLLLEWIQDGSPPLHYQPKVELTTGRTLGAEALLRACDIDGELLCPLRIQRIAAQQHLLADFEWSTIKAVVRDLRYCREMERSMSLSVNISSVSLTDATFAERVIELLRAERIDGGGLYIEVTESSPVPETDIVRENMNRLRDAGVRLSLDDFGSGYSALALLAQYPFNEVKIDHSMVARLDQPRMRVAVSLALESAQRYNASLIAEGVETQKQLDTLIQLGVRCGQGYLFSAAVPLVSLGT